MPTSDNKKYLLCNCSRRNTTITVTNAREVPAPGRGHAVTRRGRLPRTRAGNGVGAEVLHPEPLTRSGWWPSLSHRTLELRELRGCKNTTENETAVFLTYVKKKKIRKVASTDKKEKKEKKKERETETSSHSG